MAITIDELEVGDDAEAWRAAGFAVADDRCRIGSVVVRLAGATGQRGLRRWSLRGVADQDLAAFEQREGIATTSSAAPPGEAAVHPLGVTRIDHVVLMTPHIARTTSSLEALGLDVRRVRDADMGGSPVRQVFFRLGEVVVEVVGAPDGSGDGPATFWGITHRVADIDASAAMLGDRRGKVRDAVQPGRRITTLRTGDMGISVATALISEKPEAAAIRPS